MQTCYIERSIALNKKYGNYYFPRCFSAEKLYIKKAKYRKVIEAAKALLSDISYKKGGIF
jgi:hypothetical protein